jgi:dolichol-phosphate mannosyltransferase
MLRLLSKSTAACRRGRRTSKNQHRTMSAPRRPPTGIAGTGKLTANGGVQLQYKLDIVVPVYNEGANILSALAALARNVRTPSRVLICYDMPEDDTLPVVRDHPEAYAGLAIEFVRNPGRGPHQAVMSGFGAGTSPFVVMYAADDDFNAGILDQMVALGEAGCDVVCASRFMPAGGMVGCPLVKALLVRMANFTLYHFARVPTRDSSIGFRLFSRRVIDEIVVESDRGFCYSIELLMKCHRLGWKIGEVPARCFERKHGQSRFRLFRWLPAYLRWYGYAFATTFLRRPGATVPMKGGGHEEAMSTRQRHGSP